MMTRTLSSSLVILGALAAAATPASAAMVPCVNGQAGVYPCKGVDLMAFVPHSTWAGGNGNDMWGWTDPQTGHEYAIIGTVNGTAFVDVTVPENPIYVGFLPAPPNPPITAQRHGGGPPVPKETTRCQPGDDVGLRHGNCAGTSAWRDMEVYADHVYIGSEQANHGLVVFDLRQLRDVTTPPVTFANTFVYRGIGNAHTITVNPQSGIIFINGSRTATVCPQTNTGGPVMLDASVNPSAPTFAGCNLLDGYTHDSQCLTYNGPDAAYAGREICFNSNEDTLTIMDATNKQAPAMLSRTGYQGVGYTHQGWLTADSRYFLLDDELDENNFHHNTKTYIWDVGSLTAPRLIGTHFGTTAAIDHNQYIVGHYSYQSNYRAGLHILDTGRAGLGKLREVAYFDVYPGDNNRGFNGTWANYPFFASGTVVVNTIESGSGVFVLRPRRANLHLEVAPLLPGVYRLTVTNQGPDAVESADVTLSGGSVRSVQPSQGSCTRRPAICNLGALANGASATVDVSFSPFVFPRTVHAEAQGVGALDGTPEDDAVDIVSALGWR